MRYLILSLLIFLGPNGYAQEEALTKDAMSKIIQDLQFSCSKLQQDNAFLKSEIYKLNNKIVSANKLLDTLKNESEANRHALSLAEKHLGSQITTSKVISDKKIDAVGQSVSHKSLYGVVGIIATILLSVLLYLYLLKKQQTSKTELDGQIDDKTSTLKQDVIAAIEKTKKDLQQENINLDLKLIELLDKQMQAKSDRRTDESSQEISAVDHSIPLKVADEITRINAYANTLDPNSQDAKALKSSVKRLINTFKAAHYEIIDLLGQKYDDGMKVIVINEIEDTKVDKLERVIIRIHKPLVKYKNEQIQAAQVDIATGI
jgi:hypothetical protein